MEGRDTPSRGLDTTAKFLAMNLARWKFKPAGDDGTYFQKIALRSESIDPANTKLKIGNQQYAFGDDFLRLSGNTEANGVIVFAGSGWMVKAKNIDAFQGVDVKGKIVAVYSEGFPGRTLTRPPSGVTQDDLKGTKGVDWADPVTHAKTAGAAGILLIASAGSECLGPGAAIYIARHDISEKLRDVPTDPSAANFPVLIVSDKIGDTILAGSTGGKTSTMAFDTGKTAAIKTASHVETKWTQNVVALWEGSDPVLKNEMVAIGAHYDHVGMNPNAPGDGQDLQRRRR